MTSGDLSSTQGQQPLDDSSDTDHAHREDGLSVPLLGESTEACDERRVQVLRRRVWAWLTFVPRLAWNNGVVCINITMVVYAFMWVVTKELSLVHIPLFQAIFCRSLSGSILTAILCKSMGVTPIFGDRKMYGWLAARGTVGTVAMTLVFSAFFLIPVGDGSALQQFSTVFVFFFAWVCGWEKASIMAGTGGLVCTLGGILVSNPPFLHGGHEDWGSSRLLGIIMVLVGAAMTGLAYTLINRIGKSVHSMSVTMWYHTPSCLLSIIPLAVGFPSFPVIFLTWKQGAFLVSWVCLGFVGQLMQTRSYQLCRASTAASIQTTSVVYSYLLGFLVLGERITYVAMGGTALIGVGLVLVAEGKRRGRKAAFEEAVERSNDPENPEE